MRKIRSILRLKIDNKLSNRKISESQNISRDSVSDYLNRFKGSGLTWPLAPEIDDFILETALFPSVIKANEKVLPEWSEIHQEMKSHGATLQGLHTEYIEINPNGLSYSRFCFLYKKYLKTIKSSLRQTFKAGEKVFVDYSGDTIKIYDSNSHEPRIAQIFVGVLGASNYTYAEATWSQNKENWIGSHVRMFEFFKGVPTMIVCDNLKSGVTKASRTDPVINPTYNDLAEHYGTIVFPARARKPQDKAKVEGGVLIVQRWILFRLRKQIFTNLKDLNIAIAKLLTELNERPFKKLDGCRHSAFKAIDQPALKTLPVTPYQYREFLKLRVNSDYHVEVYRHFYSVPYQLTGKEVEAIITQGTIEILNKGTTVARHTREYLPGNSTLEQHMTEAHRRFGAWKPEFDLDWAATIGESTVAVLQAIFSKAPHQDMSYRWANGLKSLAKQYGEARLEAGCKLAIEFNGPSTSTVKSILKNRLDLQNFEESVQKSEANFDHENIRGRDYYR